MLSKLEHLEEAQALYKRLGSSEKVAKFLCEKYNVEYTASQGRKIRQWMETPKEEQEIPSEIFEEAKKKKSAKGKKYYIVSSAQNATPINKSVWNNIKAYSEVIGAEIEIIPIRYKNPTSVNADLPDDWWAEDVRPYLIANRHNIHRNVVVLGDVKTQLTASTPLSGMEGLTGEETSIIGHPRQHFNTLPILEGQIHKFVVSTGIITEPNYTDSKVGKKGEFHHTYGFAIVEDLGGEKFNFRQVSCQSNGDFYDLDYFVSNGEVVKDVSAVEAVVLGDLHIGDTCPQALGASYEMLERFNPKHVICHDIMDGYSVNPHEKKDPFILAEKEADGLLNIDLEIKRVLNFLETINEWNPVVVKSNHDIFIDRFLLDNDWRKSHGKKEYLKYAYLKSIGAMPNGVLPFEINNTFPNQQYPNSVVCLTESSSFKIKGVEVAQHGHLGNSGSKGAITQFKRLNTKGVYGHSHCPRKEDGCVYVGTLTKLRVGYNKGLSTWCNSNVLIHKNGKTQNILIFDGKYSNL
jgi:hypothetical protein